MKILIIEDEIKTSSYLSKGLSENNFVVDVSYDGEDGAFRAIHYSYDLIILDVMLPKLDGWTVIQKIRCAKPNSRVLFLTARDDIEDRVKGLSFGADDYLVKPFAFSELLARVRSILRRGVFQGLTQLCIADLEIDLIKHKAARKGIRLDLTAKEFLLLTFLAKHSGEVLSRTLIAEQVWDINFHSETNVVDVAIRRLRQKVDESYEKKLIHTVRSIGYVLEER